VVLMISYHLKQHKRPGGYQAVHEALKRNSVVLQAAALLPLVRRDGRERARLVGPGRERGRSKTTAGSSPR
jgi:hypothetical protein